MTDDQPIRPQAVQAAYDLLITFDPSKIDALKHAGLTSAEYREAMKLLAASLLAMSDHRERQVRAWEVLLEGQRLDDSTTWSDLFDGLTPERAARLGELYDALPDQARDEYDRRYGRPDLDDDV